VGVRSGLPHSAVEYSDLTLSSASVRRDQVLVAEVTVANTGPRPVRQTVQLYVRDGVTSASWAGKELKGYSKFCSKDVASLIHAHPTQNEQACQHARVSSSRRALHDRRRDGRRVVEPGDFESSRSVIPGRGGALPRVIAG